MMKRRDLLTGLALTAGASASGTLALLNVGPALASNESGAGDYPPVDLDREDWREVLPADRFRILFDEKTEPAFSSPLDQNKEPGTYICAACFLPLFSSDDKFDSGTGWPSFTQPIEGRVDTKLDFKLIIPRTEYHCARCGGHQGHVFDDGPPPTGQRWCNNGLALEFVARGDKLPPLRTST